MTTFESSVKKIASPQERIYNFLSDFNHFGEVIPKDKITNWQSDGDSCRFTVDPLGEVGLRIVEKEASKTIKFTGEGKVPFNFFLWIQLKEAGENDTRMKLTIKADMNPMVKMMASNPVKKFWKLWLMALQRINTSSAVEI